MRSEITRIRKATESAHREHSASYGPSLRSQRCFREEEGLGPPGVLTGSFFHDGDTTAWSRVGPARGHSAGTLRPGQGLSRAGPLGRAKCSQGGVAKTSRAPGQRLPWAWVAGVGEALTLPYQGQWEPKTAPEAAPVCELHLVFGEGPRTQSPQAVKTIDLESRWPGFRSSLCCLPAP